MTKIVSLDLEMNQPSGRIIQIGAAVGCTEERQVTDRFSAIVDPGEPISDFIATYTGVTQERVTAEGVPLQDAAKRLFDFVALHKPFMNPVTWGHGDAETLRAQLGLEDERWVFGRRSVDVKTVHVMVCLSRGLNPKGGLAKTMANHYSMAFEGRAHDAMFDAVNTMRLFFEMQKRYFMEPLQAPID